MKLKVVLAILFAALIVIFSLQNSGMTDVKFIVWKLSITLVIMILGSFAIGVLVGFLVSIKSNIAGFVKVAHAMLAQRVI